MLDRFRSVHRDGIREAIDVSSVGVIFLAALATFAAFALMET